MELTQMKWLEKFEEEGTADDTFLLIRDKQYTPRELASMDYVFWKQVVKSIWKLLLVAFVEESFAVMFKISETAINDESVKIQSDETLEEI